MAAPFFVSLSRKGSVGAKPNANVALQCRIAASKLDIAGCPV